MQREREKQCSTTDHYQVLRMSGIGSVLLSTYLKLYIGEIQWLLYVGHVWQAELAFDVETVHML